MGDSLNNINKIRNDADKFKKKLATLSQEREFDSIIFSYEKIIEELIYGE